MKRYKFCIGLGYKFSVGKILSFSTIVEMEANIKEELEINQIMKEVRE